MCLIPAARDQRRWRRRALEIHHTHTHPGRDTPPPSLYMFNALPFTFTPPPSPPFTFTTHDSRTTKKSESPPKISYRRRWGCIARMASALLKLARARWAGRGAPDPSARQGASDFDPTSHADFGAATHPGVGGGRWHAPSSRNRRSLLSGLVVCSFVCLVVWWFLWCVCCACDLCFVKILKGDVVLDVGVNHR